MISINGHNYVIDSGPDFRQQMLRENVLNIRALLFTHEHKDHVAGMDDLRAFNFKYQKDMDVYCDLNVERALKREFPYAFTKNKYPGVPSILVHLIEKTKAFQIEENIFIPIEVMHHKLPVMGFRLGGLTYITDAKTVAPDEIEKIKGTDVLVINALRLKEHISHFNLKQALEFIQIIQPKRAYLTHISHYLGKHEDISLRLPKNVYLAYDGLKISI
jgi:phosphoribosyl 1,2-cyclic phosphate phosphodiesterase